MARARSHGRPRVVRPEARQARILPFARPLDPLAETAAKGGESAWMERRRNLTLALIFLPPLGAAMVWLATDWLAWAKWLATAWALLWILAALGFAFSVLAPGARQPTAPTSWGFAVVAAAPHWSF